MSMPAEIQTVILTWGRAFDVLGQGGTSTLSIEPVTPGTSKLVWLATGDPLMGVSASKAASDEAGESVSLPVVDQTGWVDSAGHPYTDWAYKGTLVWRSADGARQAEVKTFKVLSGQTVVDWDTIFTGTVGAPTVAPLGVVTSVAGISGEVTQAALEELGLGGATDEDVAQLVADEASATRDALAFAAAPLLPGGVEVPLSIPTYDGDPNVTHPSVKFFPSGFGSRGHRYWMAYTPYPNDPRENPAVASSPDGVTWTIPPGAPDPVVPYSEIAADGWVFNSDPSLLILEDGRLAMYYRPVKTSIEIAIMRKTTADGVTWSAAETILRDPYTPGTAPYRSPSLVRDDDGTVRMYTIGETAANVAYVAVRTSTDDGATFGAPVAVTTPTSASRIWHLDVIRHGGRYWMLMNRRWDWDLELQVSDDGVTFTTVRRIPKTGTPWDALGHYRSTLLPSASGQGFDIWLSGIDGSSPTAPTAPTAQAPTDAQWRFLLMRDVRVDETGNLNAGTAHDPSSVAVGRTATTGAQTEATAAGIGASVTANRGVAVGSAATAGSSATAVGAGASATGTSAIAVGEGAAAAGAQGVVIGRSATGAGTSSVAVGYLANTVNDGVAVGVNANAAERGTAVGEAANAAGTGGSMAYGSGATASGGGAVAIGRLAEATAGSTTALGRIAKATHAGSVALGNESVTTETNQVMVGNRNIESTRTGGAIVLRSPDGTRYRLTVTDAGTLAVTVA